MLNGKLENSFISGQDKETLRRTRTERQNYEELSKEFRERIVKDLDTKELKSLTQKSGASLLSIQALMKVQGSYLRNIDNNLKKLVKINDNFIKALTKNLSLGTRINLGNRSSRLGSYAVDNRSNILKDNKDYANLSKNISTFTDVLKELDKKQRDRNNEVLSMLSEVPTDLSTNISMAIDKTLRDHPMLRKIYGTLSATAGSALNWTRQGITEMLGLPGNFSLSNLTKIVSWNTTGKWEREVRINKSLPLQTIISLLSSIQKQTWLINNDALFNIQNGRKNVNRELEDKGGLKRFADSLGPGLKNFFKGTAIASLMFPTVVGTPVLWSAKGSMWLGTLIGKIGISILTLLGKGIINYPVPATFGITAATMILNRAKTNAKRLADNEKKLNKMRSEAQGNWFNPDYETIKVGGKTLTEKDRSKTWAGYIKEEFTKGFWRESLSKGFGKTIGGMWKSIFNQDALRKEREANDKEAEAKAIQDFKNKFLISIAKRGQDVADAFIGLKEMEYDIKLMRQQVVGKSNFKEVEEAKKLIADLQAQQAHAEDDNNEGTFRGSVIKGIMWLGGKGKDLLGKGVDKLNQKYTWANNISTNVKDKFDKGKDWVSDKYTKGKNWLSGKISDKVKGNALSIWDFFTDGARPKSFFKDWFNDELYGSDRGKGILSLINGNGNTPGWLQQAKDNLDEVSKDKKSKGNNFSNIPTKKDLDKIFDQNEQGTFAFGLYQRLGLEPNQTIANRLKEIHDQLWYKTDKTFSNVLFGKIDRINKYLWEVIGTEKDKDNETKLYGIVRQIFTELGQTSPKPRGKTLKHIVRGALDPDLKSNSLNAAGVIPTQQPLPVNFLTRQAAKGKNARNANNQNTTLDETLIKATNKARKGSVLYSILSEIHDILKILQSNLNTANVGITNSKWTKPIHYFAKGALVDGPTLAMTGEAGPEKVQPLTGPVAEEVHRQEAKGIFGYLKDYFNEGYQRADKSNFNRLGSTVEGLLNIGFKGSGHLMYKAAMTIVKLPNTLKEVTEKVDAVDQVLTGKARVISGSFIDKVSKGFDFVDSGLAKLIKPITKIDNLWPEDNESFMSVLLRNTSDIIGDKAKVIGKGLQGWSVKALNWIDQTAQGKTKTGKRLYAFGNYLKNDLDTFKKRWKNTYEPFFKDPLTAIFAKSGTKLPFFISMISKAILPVASIGLFYLLSSSRVKGAITKFATELIPNIFKKGLFKGTLDNLGNLSDIMPTLSDQVDNSASGHITAGAKVIGGRVVAGGMDLMSIYKNVSTAATKFGEGDVSEGVLSSLESLNDLGRTSFAGLMEYLHIMPYNIASAAYQEFANGAASLAVSNGEKAKEQEGLKWYQHIGNTWGQSVQAVTKLFHGDKEGARKSIASAMNSMDQNAENFKYVPIAGQLNYLGAKSTKIGMWMGNKLFGIGTNPFDTLEDQHKAIDKMYQPEKEKEMSNAEFLKIRSEQYGFKDVNKLPLEKQKSLRFMINQLESPEANKNMTPMDREKLKFEIAALGNSEYIVKLGKDGSYNIDKNTFTTTFRKSDEFKSMKELFEKYKDRKQVKRIGAGYTLNGGKYKSFLSGDLFKGNVDEEIDKLITWLKNEYGELYVRYFTMLPDQRKSVYLNMWMDWRYPENMADYVPERGITIAEAIRKEGKDLVNKQHKDAKTDMKSMTPNLKLALRNLDSRDGSDVHKMTIRMKKNNQINIFGKQPANGQPNAASTISGTVIGGNMSATGTAPRLEEFPKAPNSIAEKLALASQNVALSMGGYKSRSECAKGVKRALLKAGILTDYPSGHAYAMADILSKSGKFYDITSGFSKKSDLIQAPRGSIIVWGRSPIKEYGHVAVSLGNGRESSDHVRDTIIDPNNKYSGFRVFYPIGNGPKPQEGEEGGIWNGTKNLISGIGNYITNTETYKTVSDKVSEGVQTVKNGYDKYVPEKAKKAISTAITAAGNTITDIKKFYNEDINPSMKRAADAAWAETRNAKNWGGEYRQFSRWNPFNTFSSSESLDQDSLGQIQGDVQKVYDQWSKKWGYYNDSKEAKESWERLTSRLEPGQKAFAEMYFQKLSENANPIMTKYNEMKSKFEEMTNKSLEVATETGNQLLEKGNELAAKAKDEAKKQSDKVVDKLDEIKEVLSEKGKELKQGAVNLVHTVQNSNEVKNITNATTSMINYAGEQYNNAASGTANLLNDFNY